MVALISIYTDGMGTYQARCLTCPTRGPWRRTEARAVADAEAHGATHDELTNGGK